MATIVAAVAAAFQAIFAFVLLVYIIKQKGIMADQTRVMQDQTKISKEQAETSKKQTKIMEEQKEINVKQTEIIREQAEISGRQSEIMEEQKGIGETQTRILDAQKDISADQAKFSQLIPMLTEYGRLSNSRRQLWHELEKAYDKWTVREQLQRLEPLHVLIENAGFPEDFESSPAMDVRRFVRTRMAGWRDDPLWKFVTFVYDPEDRARDWAGIDDHRNKLAYFWDTWARLQDVSKYICQYMSPDPRELAILIWLEFALIARTERAQGPGKVAFFQLARSVWKSSSKERKE